MDINQIDTSLELPIMEDFYTVQGEGFHTGRAAYFVRTAGCNVGCVWCDVKESWDAKKHQLLSLDKIVKNIVDSQAGFCVITGGEPCMYDLTSLTKKIKAKNIYIAIETSGCYELKGNIDWYCFSPKKFSPPKEEAYKKANELKIVISHPSDFKWAEIHASKVSKNCKLYLQTEWSKKERFLPLIINYVKNNTKWKISLQTHKTMNIP